MGPYLTSNAHRRMTAGFAEAECDLTAKRFRAACGFGQLTQAQFHAVRTRKSAACLQGENSIQCGILKERPQAFQSACKFR